MTVELITGHAGSAHVLAADAGWLNVGVVGDGKYVLDTGTQFACNVQSANAVTIGIGDALFEGRHVRVSATETVALDNGAQGVKRNDLICIKYKYNSSTSVESASLVVLKGTATSGTPSDPTIPSGSILNGATAAYMALWRIPISGITVGTPVKLYGEVLSPLDGIYSKTWAASQIPNLPASKITSGTFNVARIPGLPASKITSEVFQPWQLPDLDAGKIVSGTFDVARIPDIPASKITSGTLAVARGGTGKTYGYTWQQLGTSTGSTAISFRLSGYSEVLVACYVGTSYLGTAVIPSALLSSTAKQIFLGGGVYDSVAASGRYFAANITNAKLTPTAAMVDGTNNMSSAHWYVYAR